MQDRLADLRKNAKDDVSPVGKAMKADVEIEMQKLDSAKGDMDDCLLPYEGVRAGIARIEANIEEINILKQKSNKEVKDDAHRAIMKELDLVMMQTRKEAREIKKVLDTQMAENDAYCKAHEGSTSAQMRKNMLMTNTRHFQESMNEFQTASQAFKASLKERIGRQARIVQEDITEDQIEEMIEGDNPGAVFQNAMLELDDSLLDAVHEIEDQHKGLQRIEQGVKEIQELFQDMAMLVDLQQETLDVIERNVADTQKYTLDAEKNIAKAEIYQKNSRRTQCYIMLFMAAGAAVLVFFLLGT